MNTPIVRVIDGKVVNRWVDTSLETVRAEVGLGAELYAADAYGDDISLGEGEFVPPKTVPEDYRAQFPLISARQFQKGLINAGHLPEDIDVLIKRIEDPIERALTKTDWEKTSRFHRTHPLVDFLTTQLGLTLEQVDNIWKAALEL